MCRCATFSPRSVIAFLICLAVSPFAHARGEARTIYLTSRSSLCIDALSSFRACVPASLFSGSIVDPGPANQRDTRRLSNQRLAWEDDSCDASASVSQKQKRQRLVESLIGVKMPDLSVSMRGLKLALDVDTDMTGIHYNGVKLQYKTCW
ncbi:MAG: hypothetical protein GC138_00635 [Gammaproteobacteria bacterium]|nr:hypothetical protein [Gammaproteobacteria bacterium]